MKKNIQVQPYPIITVTGTKGKTTIVRLLDHVYRHLSFHTLRVDTDGHFVDQRQKSNYFTSRHFWGMVPNNCPGKYIFELQKKPFVNNKKWICLFEAAIGSSSSLGLGYAKHDIGIFTNVYRDHITNVRIKNRNDIYRAKRFIFEQLKNDGTLIYNASNTYLAGKISKETINKRIVAIGYTQHRPVHSIDENNVFFEIQKKSKKLYIHTHNMKKEVCNLTKIPFTYNGQFEPNIFNISFVYASLFSYMGENVFMKKVKKIGKILENYTVDDVGGRLVVIQKKNYTIIVDFAHETESFIHIAKLAKYLSTNRVIGVLRIDPSRINTDIEETAKKIWKYFDVLYIYDKVDGIKMKQSTGLAEGKKRNVGESANLFAHYITLYGHKQCSVILRERNALSQAVNGAKKGDVIVYIGDGYDHRITLNNAHTI